MTVGGRRGEAGELVQADNTRGRCGAEAEPGHDQQQAETKTEREGAQPGHAGRQPVLDDHPGTEVGAGLFAGPYRGPEIGERGRRHVRVTDDVVRFADQLLPLERADLDEGRVGEDDVAVEIGLGNQLLIRTEDVFCLGNRGIVAHDRGEPPGRVAGSGRERRHT